MQEWYVHENGNTLGPFTTEAVKEAIKAGKHAQATFCATGTTTFRPLAELPELAPAQPTQLPMAGEKCAACTCPIARNIKKILLVAVLAAVALAVWKFGFHGCCHHKIGSF